MSTKSSRGNGSGLAKAKARKAKGGHGISASKRAKIKERNERIAALNTKRSEPKFRHGSLSQ